MNEQTKSVIKAMLIGFAASFTVAAFNLLAGGRLKPMDPYWTLNPSIIGYWTSPIGIIPLFFALGAIVLRFRKASLWFTVLNFLCVIVTIPILVSIMAVTVTVAHPPAPEFPYAAAGTEREWFVRDTVETCRQKARANPQNATVSQQTVQDYCTCYAISLADATTREHVEYQARYGTYSPDAKAKLQAASDRCVRSLRN
jgi:hypothetical protein